MKYNKPAFDVEQQLEQLIRRGMAVADEEAAKQRLLHLNYYRLRAYWLPDEVPTAVPGDHAFKSGTQFETILDLYSFDRKLRLLVMDAIERVEVSLRTRWAYMLSLRYGAHAYLDPALFSKTKDHEKCLAKLRAEFENSRETFVLHYRKTYSEPDMPPLWGACELLTFGQLSLWFQNIKDGTVRAEISRPYGVDEQIIKSFAHHLTYVRNVCAHHSRLWNREMTVGMKVPARPDWLGAAFNAEKPKRLYNTLVMLTYMLDTISARSQWRANLLALLGQHPKVDLAAMGFPADWRDSAIWETRP
jgi:abortive infection bacteriophage resistance protein